MMTSTITTVDHRINKARKVGLGSESSTRENKWCYRVSGTQAKEEEGIKIEIGNQRREMASN